MRDELADRTEGVRRSTVVLTNRAPVEAARAFMATRALPDPGAVTVITPGRLAARAMGVGHRSLVDLALSALAVGGLRFAGALTRRAALQAAVAESWSTDDPGGTARSVEGTVRELLAAGAGVGNVADVDGFPRLTKLLALVAAYRSQLAAGSLVDRAEALWLAAHDLGLGRRQIVTRDTVLVSGYATLAPAEVAFLSRYAAPGSLLVLPGAPAPHLPSAVPPDSFALNEEIAAALSRDGWQTARDEVGAEPSRRARTSNTPLPGVPVVAGYRLTSLDAEVRFVLTAVKRLLLDGVAAADMTLVAADPRAYGPVVVAVASEYGIAVHRAHGVPLAATPVGYLVGSIAGVVAAGLPFEETARLLSHHLVRKVNEEAWAEARRRLPTGVAAWTRFDDRVTTLAWPRRATRGEYTTLLGKALADLGALEALESEPASRRHLELLTTTLEVYAASLAAGADGQAEPAVRLATYVSELLDHMQLVETGWSGSASGADGVALVANSALAGAAVDHVFVLGAAEGAIPARLDPGPRLDFIERQAARSAGLLVTDATLAARREGLTFDAIVRAARQSLTLSYPESGERSGQLASPYFAALGLMPLAQVTGVTGYADMKPPASDRELRRYLLASGRQTSLPDDAVLARARHALAVEGRRESAAPPDEYDGIIGTPYPTSGSRFSATSLLALGQCAFKWFAQYALRLYEPQEADEELSPLVRGNLYHHTLEIAFEAARLAGAYSRENVLAALPAAFATAEEREARYTANWQHHRHQHLAALQRVVRAESFLPEGTEVVGAETRFGAGSGPPAKWRGFEVSGRIDRIDRRSGELTLVDYKTSSGKPLGVQDAAGEAKVDLQLPIYLEAAVPALGLAGPAPNSVPAAAEYYSLTKARVIASTSLSGGRAFDSAALDAFAERAHAYLSTGRYPVKPDRARRACDYCAFDAVCRVGPRVERKRGADG